MINYKMSAALFAAAFMGASCASTPASGSAGASSAALNMTAADRCVSDNPAARPTLFIWDWDNLQKSKAALRAGNSDLKSAYDKLVRDAGKAMSEVPVTVTAKTKLPPSDDKADYMSVGPYWWPDPRKSDGLPYIKRDGEVNPERYDETFDNNRLSHFSKTTKLLAMAGYFTGNKTYSDKAAQWVRTWFLNPDTRMNPNLNYGQAIPGITDGRGIGIIDSYGFVRVIDSIGLLEHSGALSPSEMAGLRNWFKAYSVWLVTSKNGMEERKAHNNHGVYFDAQLTIFSAFSGEMSVMPKIIDGVIKERIPGQITKDGKLPHELKRTRPFHYTNYTLQGFYDIADVAACAGIDLWSYETAKGQGLRSATDFIAGWSGRMDDWPYKEIRAVDYAGFYENMLRAEKAYGAPDYHAKTSPYSAEQSDEQVNLLYPQ